MRKNVKFSKADKKGNKPLKTNKFLLKKLLIFFISLDKCYKLKIDTIILNIL